MKILSSFAAILVLLSSISTLSSASDESLQVEKPATDTSATHKGTVISSFDEDGYTYIKYQNSNAISWVAVLQVPVKVKDIVEFQDNQALLNYQSRTLKEPFEKIIFATEFKISDLEKPNPAPSDEVRSDNVVTVMQKEVVVEKQAQAVTEEGKTEKQTTPKTEGKKSDIHRGEVISTINTSGYTYIEYAEDGVVSWVAVQETPVKTGDIIEFPDSQMMKNFGSKSLKKNFDRLYMASQLRIVPKDNDNKNNI